MSESVSPLVSWEEVTYRDAAHLKMVDNLCVCSVYLGTEQYANGKKDNILRFITLFPRLQS